MKHSAERILAIDPTTKGFGYVVFELPFRLVEWSLIHVSGDKYSGGIAALEKLLARFRPDRVVLEDVDAIGSRRQPRVRRLIDGIVTTAGDRGIAVTAIARAAVLKCFAQENGPTTKHSIAERLAKYFPELEAKLPRRRKPWQSENEGISVFDALALAVTYATA